MPKKPETENCAFCGHQDVTESGFYSCELPTTNENENKYWYCCVLHNNMYRHKYNMTRMPQDVYNNEIDKLRSYKKRHRKT